MSEASPEASEPLRHVQSASLPLGVAGMPSVHEPGFAPAPARLLRPCVRIWTEPLFIERGDGLRSQLEELKAPVLALRFEYEGFTARASDPRDRVFASLGGQLVALSRDRKAEARARMVLEALGAIELEALADYAVAPGSEADYAITLEGSTHQHCAFTARAVPQLRALGFGVEIADGYPYQVLTEAAPWYAVVSEAERPDWFGLELGIEIDGHRIDLLPVLLDLIEETAKKSDLDRLMPSAPRFVRVTERNAYVEVPAERFRTLVRVLSELYQGTDVLAPHIAFPAVRAAALCELAEVFGRDKRALPITLELARAAAERMQALSGLTHGHAGPEPTPLAAPVHGVAATLRPYQLAGLAWLERVRAAGAAGVLADDMGLGKTLQTIAHLCRRKQDGAGVPSLVVTPTSLVGNWRRELARFAPSLRVVVLYGADRKKRYAELPDADVAIVSYSVLTRDLEQLQRQAFDYVVLDEAQAIKNPRSQAAQAAKALESSHRLCLSGTPIENHLGELWSLFDFLMPGLLGSAEQFRAFYAGPIAVGNEERVQALRAQVGPYVLRRMKEQVVPELPPKTEITRAVELTGKQRDLYESIRVAAHTQVRTAIRKKGLSASTVAILDALMKLRQLCCDPRLVPGEAARFVRESKKLELLLEILDRDIPQGRRVLIFSQFTSMLALIAQALEARSLRYVTLTGSTQDRDKPVRAFERGEADIFLISLKAGGTGLNLVSADTVIHYDPWWNPASQEQATDRAYRIGQQKPVFVYRLIIAGSVEERMLALQEHKRRLARSVIGSGEGTRLQEIEVEHLLSPLDDGE